MLQDFLKQMNATIEDIKKEPDEFIKEHTHICYTEAIIYPDGRICYCKPSHVETLIRASGKSRDEIDEMMPISASPIHWLVDYTKCVAVYYHGYIVPTGKEIYPIYLRYSSLTEYSDEYLNYDPSLTDEQKKSLQKLINSKLILNNLLN